jgi:hypothetical protein
MSILSRGTKENLADFVSGGTTFELFPGNQPDSIEYLRSLGCSVEALGNYPNEAEGLVFYGVDAPPYPAIDKQFDYVFIQEPVWLAVVERGEKTTYGVVPDIGLQFVNGILRTGGLLLMSRLSSHEARYFHRHLQKHGAYTLQERENFAALRKELSL